MTVPGRPDDALARVLGREPGAFALLHRPAAGGAGTVEVIAGPVRSASLLRDLPLAGPTGPPSGPDGTPGDPEVLVLVPYRQVTERGFAAVDDREPLLCLTVESYDRLPVADVAARLPTATAPLVGGFDVSDDEYADLVRTVVRDEIAAGAGANFVVHRSWEGRLGGPALTSALAAFRRLLLQEVGAYWTFLVHTGDRTFVGASPERHVTLEGGTATMNPISGTYRYPPTGSTLDGVLDFLSDGKETDELNMVLDEEIKMMSRLCRDVRVRGPYLREMARLAHTEYLVEGRCTADVATLLRDTMLAPTVTGSPIENACRVIATHEPRGRGFYSGFVALVGHDAAAAPWVDSAILIRTADVRADGRLRVGVGATLVRHSDPDAEVAETTTKAAGILAAFEPEQVSRFGQEDAVTQALARRGARISGFWRGPTGQATAAGGGRRAVVVDAEDAFTHMIARQLSSVGWSTRVVPWQEATVDDVLGGDVAVLGPGPGDPTSHDLPRVSRVRALAGALLEERAPFVAVCLGHQVVAQLLGLRVLTHPTPQQGLQREIDLFGVREVVGFYNSYVALSGADGLDVPGIGSITVARDQASGQVHAVRGPFFSTAQYHPESVLTLGGERLLRDAVERAVRGEGRPHAASRPSSRSAARVAPSVARNGTATTSAASR
ncbi:chorismate-binding protein [Cellulomonas sp. Leaf334]|uniref:chorismate-binding protein n=1 Tax=Cellulomonas sp. Leaf334 TaxID=1736339 RepID=UPI0009E7CA26|nr:chorismate-binding protein [Cellulomonas sp. Leaf334]